MEKPNPYESPENGDDGEAKHDSSLRRSAGRLPLTSLVMIGGVSGSLLLAPFVRAPHDAGGHVNGLILGAVIGLCVGIGVHVVGRT